MKTKNNDRAIILAGIFGVIVSTYALYVEMAVEARPGYKALCDISERASCSRVLSSKYAKGFGIIPADSPFIIPNCIYGILFYCLMIFLATFEHIAVVLLQLILSFSSVATSFYLAYLLIFVLQDLCVVCVSTYIINGLIAALLYKKTKLLTVRNKTKKQ